MKLPSRYQLIEREGSGGFGEVVRATDKKLGREIAVKVLDPLMALDEAERVRFEQEARILARLSHPNIPSIYDVVFDTAEESDNDEARFQIYFEWISGQNLHNWLRENGPASLENARRWFLQIASALQHAHDADIVHRDVKPKNIMIRDNEESCCLVDFGIALSKDQADRLTKKGYVIGTEGYMSPEQLAGEEIDLRSDVYNLGVCLYETLAGTPLQRGDYKRLAQMNEGIPPAVDDLILQCLEPLEMRLDDATVFARELGNALSPRISLSSVLSHGRLSDLESSLQQMTPAEFSDRPAGQRALIIAKVLDLSVVGERRFEYPVIHLLGQLVRLGTRLAPDEYSEIIDMSLTWAFERKYSTDEIGNTTLRRALAEEATTLPAMTPNGMRESPCQIRRR